jgi:hypothetical protein
VAGRSGSSGGGTKRVEATPIVASTGRDGNPPTPEPSGIVSLVRKQSPVHETAR